MRGISEEAISGDKNIKDSKPMAIDKRQFSKNKHPHTHLFKETSRPTKCW